MSRVLVDEQALVVGARQGRERDDVARAACIRPDTQNADYPVGSEEGLERQAVVQQALERRRKREELDLNGGRRGYESAPEIHRRVIRGVNVVQSPAEPAETAPGGYAELE